MAANARPSHTTRSLPSGPARGSSEGASPGGEALSRPDVCVGGAFGGAGAVSSESTTFRRVHVREVCGFLVGVMARPGRPFL